MEILKSTFSVVSVTEGVKLQYGHTSGKEYTSFNYSIAAYPKSKI